MTLSATLTATIVSVLLPLVTAFITKAAASPSVKQFVTAALSAVAGALVTATQLDGTAVISKQAALLALATFITSSSVYRNLYRPHSLNDNLAPAIGVG